jgi:hypothetical protein
MSALRSLAPERGAGSEIRAMRPGKKSHLTGRETLSIAGRDLGRNEMDMFGHRALSRSGNHPPSHSAWMPWMDRRKPGGHPQMDYTDLTIRMSCNVNILSDILL